MGTLFIVSTPIGNLEDITIRAIKTLNSVDIIACEDTRRTGLLLEHIRKHILSINRLIDSKKPMLVRIDEHTEKSKCFEFVGLLEKGKNVALVSDAGTPLLSDPGYILVREAINRNIPIVSIPGPSALLTALTSSGLPMNQFLFLGYPPEKKSHRATFFSELLAYSRTSKRISPTLVFYCAPHKFQQTLLDVKDVFGNIYIAVARELTKVYEEVWRGKITDALEHFQNPKGEFVILLSIEKGTA